MIALYNTDCISLIPTLISAGKIHMVLADPPYAFNLDTDYSKYPGGKTYKPIIGDDTRFDFLPWSMFPAKEQFWFGAENYINLPEAGSWLCWDKYPTDISDGRISGQFELIWSKQTHKRVILRVKAVNTNWVTVKEAVGHPTQKPISLMRLIIEKYTKPGDTVFDPYMGSGTTGVACVQSNRNFIGIEIDQHYFSIAENRIATAKLEPSLFDSQPQPEDNQLSLTE